MVTEQDYLDAAEKFAVQIVPGPIESGDLYLAGRNTGIKLLECLRVSKNSYIVSKEENQYCYDTWECRKVVPY